MRYVACVVRVVRNEQSTLMNTDPKLIAFARDSATRNELDPAIVCAVIEQESAWNPHALRYESAFRARYVSPLGLSPTEEIARSISWGLMQVMGQVAREYGFAGKFLSELCDPEVGIEIGCGVLASKFERARREMAAGSHSTNATASRCISACKTASLGCVSLHTTCASQSAFLQATTATDAVLQEMYRRGLLLWNGGADSTYAEQVLRRVANYR
jgi:hypothetical protein